MSDIGDDWSLYAGHRARFSAELAACAPANGGRLCILGAGKCNDVDLQQLATVFSEIHLVDIDPPAVASAVARQCPEVRARLRPHVPVDLAGLTAKRLGKWQRKPPTRTDLEGVRSGDVGEHRGAVTGPIRRRCLGVHSDAAVVRSAASVRREKRGASGDPIFGDGHALAQLARAHARRRDGAIRFGRGVVFDVSAACPGRGEGFDRRATRGDREWRQLFCGQPEADSRCSLLRCAVGRAGRRVAEVPPWLWSGPLERTYLVYGLRVERV